MARCALGPLDRVPVDGRRTFVAGGREVTVLRSSGTLRALVTRCPHANGRLGDGEVQGDTITCPLHRWRFRLHDGRTGRDARVRATILPVEVADGELAVVLPVDGAAAGPEKRR